MNTEIKIVADSSADLTSFTGTDFASAPLKIITSQNEYVDDKNLDVEGMVNELIKYSGKSSTACPSPIDWLKAFGESKYIFCITITSALSGSHNAACIAKVDYEEQHPDRKVFVIDSLSTGPEMQLIIEKINSYIKENKSFEEICNLITPYTKKTALIFMLESMRNLANNGRVSPITAKAAGLLGIRVVGKASDKGQLEVLEKSRGEKKALISILSCMKKAGFKGGKVKIGHCLNIDGAEKLKSLISEEFKNTLIEIYNCRGLCSFYAEKGGLLVGFEC